MKKPKNSQIHVSQSVPRSRWWVCARPLGNSDFFNEVYYLIWLRLFCVYTYTYSCIWLVFQFSEVETWWERGRQYSPCQPGELFCTNFPVEKKTITDGLGGKRTSLSISRWLWIVFRTLLIATAHLIVVLPVPNHPQGQVKHDISTYIYLSS